MERDSYAEPAPPTYAQLLYVKLLRFVTVDGGITKSGIPLSFDLMSGKIDFSITICDIPQTLQAEIVADDEGRTCYTQVSGFSDGSILHLDYSQPEFPRGRLRVTD